MADDAKRNDDPSRLGYLKRFGEQLRDRRKRAKMTLHQLGKRTHISPQLISVVENAYAQEGRRPVTLSDAKLREISDALDWSLVDMNRILGRIPEGENVFHTPMPELVGRQLRAMTQEEFEPVKQAFIKEIFFREQDGFLLKTEVLPPERRQLPVLKGVTGELSPQNKLSEQNIQNNGDKQDTTSEEEAEVVDAVLEGDADPSRAEQKGAMPTYS